MKISISIFLFSFIWIYLSGETFLNEFDNNRAVTIKNGEFTNEQISFFAQQDQLISWNNVPRDFDTIDTGKLNRGPIVYLENLPSETLARNPEISAKITSYFQGIESRKNKRGEMILLVFTFDYFEDAGYAVAVWMLDSRNRIVSKRILTSDFGDGEDFVRRRVSEINGEQIIFDEIFEGYPREGFCCGLKRKAELKLNMEIPTIEERILP